MFFSCNLAHIFGPNYNNQNFDRAQKYSLLECLPTQSSYTSIDDEKLVNIKDLSITLSGVLKFCLTLLYYAKWGEWVPTHIKFTTNASLYGSGVITKNNRISIKSNKVGL